MKTSAFRHPDHRPRSRALFEEAWTPGDLVQFEALVSACALVAQSDGWVTPEETRRVCERMRTLPDLDIFDVGDLVEAFEARITDFNRDPDALRSSRRGRYGDFATARRRPGWSPRRRAPSPPPTADLTPRSAKLY